MSCEWDHGLTLSLNACIEENEAFWSCSFLFNAIQHGIETATVAAHWAAKPLTTAPSLIAYTVISLELVAFRFYLAALRAHDLNRRLKKYLPQCVL